MLAGLRKNVKRIGGIAVGATGLFIAASPAIVSVNAATSSGTNLSLQALSNAPLSVAQTYGVNPSAGTVDLGKLLTTILFPVIGGVVFIIGMRQVLKRV